MLSVYTRHAEDCKHHCDKLWRRCNRPKWIWGAHNGEFVRMSARARLWDDAERVRHRMAFPETAPPEMDILPPFTPLPLAPALPPTRCSAVRTHTKTKSHDQDRRQGLSGRCRQP
jgi:hypothetical protein